MGKSAKIYHASLEIYFEYAFTGEFLECDSWTAYIPGTNIEVLIPDRSLSEEIEEHINKWLDKELDLSHYDYYGEWLRARRERAFEGDR